MDLQNSLLGQGEERNKIIKNTIKSLDKLHKNKNNSFINFCKKLVPEYSSSFLKKVNPKELYDYYTSLHSKFIKNLNSKIFVSVEHNTGLKSQDYQNRLTAEVIVESRPFIVSSLQNYFYKKQYYNIAQLTYPVIPVSKVGKTYSVANDNR